MSTTMGYYGQRLRILLASWVILMLHVGARESIPSDRSDQSNYYFGYETEPYAKRRHQSRSPPKSEKVKSVKKKEDKLLKFLKGTAPSTSNIFSAVPTNKKENKATTQKGHSSDLKSDAYTKQQKTTKSSLTKTDAPHAPKKIASKDTEQDLSARRKKQHSKKSNRPKREKLGDKSSKAQKSKQGSAKKVKQPQGLPPTRSPTRSDSKDNDDDTLAYDDEEDSCHSKAAKIVMDVVPDAIVQNPSSCCDHTGTIAAYVTHSNPTTSFWQTAYATILSQSEAASTCFIFSGINDSSPTLHQSLLDVTMTVSTLPEVATLMVVDVTTTTLLVTALRHMHQSLVVAPLVGVWHSGYDNVLFESITSGFPTLPYVGVASSDREAAFGTAAAQLFPTTTTTSATALCAIATESSSSECAHWFAASERRQVTAVCSDDNNNNFTIPTGVDVVWATAGCCERVVSMAAATTVLVGCHHDDRGSTAAYAVLRQPVTLQATMAAAWSNAAMAASAMGGSGRFAFPAVGTIVATQLEPVLSLRR